MSIMTLIPGIDPSYIEAKRFDCKHCGCAFVANDKEFLQYKDLYGRTVFFMNCPCCNNVVRRYEE